MGRREQQSHKDYTTTHQGGKKQREEGDGSTRAFDLAWGLRSGFVIRLLGTCRDKWDPFYPLRPRMVPNSMAGIHTGSQMY